MSDNTCMAKMPAVRLDTFDLIMVICGAPVIHEYHYECECGHERIGKTCELHTPEGAEVGCLICVSEKGHECRMMALPVEAGS